VSNLATLLGYKKSLVLRENALPTNNQMSSNFINRERIGETGSWLLLIRLQYYSSEGDSKKVKHICYCMVYIINESRACERY
jgi:hypothetical protein